MADILTDAALYNHANAVQTIFTLKNHFDHADRVEIAPVVHNPLGDNEYDIEEIRKRYTLDVSKEEENGSH